jgi:hypothetical protein
MTYIPAGPDYEKAMLHMELALRRTSDALRRKGEANIEDAMWLLAEEISTLAEEARQAAALSLPPHEPGAAT